MSTKAESAVVVAVWIAVGLLLAGARSGRAQLAESPESDVRVDYRTEIRPLFDEYCNACHGADAARREANLRLDAKRFAFADRGGYRAIVAGKPEESEAWLRISSAFAEDRMPPYNAGLDLGDEQKALIRRWIEQGAEWPEEADREPSTEGRPATTAQAAPRRRPSGLPAVEVPAEPFVIHTHEIADVRVVPMTRGLSHPWSLAFLPKGDLLITERSGSLRRVVDGELVPEPIAGVPTDVVARSLSGMMEVALHPRFEQTTWST
jgi:mono/diheme cytochrome c family protein